MQAKTTVTLPIFARFINLKFERTSQLSEDVTYMVPKTPDYTNGLLQLFGILIASVISTFSALRVGRIQGAAAQRSAEANAKAISDNGQAAAVNQFQQNIIADLVDLRSMSSKCQTEQDILREKVLQLDSQLHAAGIREMGYVNQIDRQDDQIKLLSTQLEESKQEKRIMQGEIEDLKQRLKAYDAISE